jgi:hypothetical protein
MRVTDKTLEALYRLSTNQDFAEFVDNFLRKKCGEETDKMIQESDPVLVYRAQGGVITLQEILKTIENARESWIARRSTPD